MVGSLQNKDNNMHIIYFIDKPLSIKTKAVFDPLATKMAVKCIGTSKMQFWHFMVKNDP